MKITKNKINLITTILYILCILIYEVFYCNFSMIKGINTIYNFSAFRILFYILVYIVYFIFKDKFIDTAIESLESNKKKKLTLIFAIILSVILILTIGSSIVSKTINLWQIIAILTIILSYIFLIYVSNNLIKNTILLSITAGIIFSLSIVINNQLDEKKHFLSAYSLSLRNFSHTNHTVDLSISEINRGISVEDFNEFFSKKPENKLTKKYDADDECDKPAGYYIISYIPSAIGIFIARTLRR